MLSDEASGLSTPVLCDECRRFLHEFYLAVREVTELHENQSSAVLQGDLDFERFDLMIHAANEKKLRAKYAFLEHLGQHGWLKATASG
jgi:hypothetical protein